GHHDAPSPGREHRGGRRRADAWRSPRQRKRRLEDHGRGGSVPRTAGANDRSLSGLRVSIFNDMTPLSGWQNFYVIVGSSAAVLIGSHFVFMTLVANMPITRVDAHAGNTFTTPSVVHFGVV